jgi:arylsulfatase
MMHEGAARFVYNLVGVNVSVIDAEEPLPAGEHQVRAEFAYDGGGLAKGGTVTLYYDGEQTGQGTLAATAPIGFSPNETAGIGHELGTTVLPGTAPPTPSSAARSTGFTSPPASPITVTWSTPKTSSTC